MGATPLATIVVSLLLCVMESNTQSIFNSCSGDVIFVMDASSSIWVVDFNRQLEFVANLVDTFDIGPGTNEVGISAITFSDRAHLDFALNRYHSRTELKKAILNIPYRMGGTNTAEALRLLRRVVRPYIGSNRRPIIAVVITDGLSWDTALTKEEAEKAHRLGLNIHAIGVGKNYDMTELKSIASDPVNGVHEVTSYSALSNIADKFRVRLCEVILQTTVPSTTPTPKTSPAPPKTTSSKQIAVKSWMSATFTNALFGETEIMSASTESETKRRQNTFDPLNTFTVEAVGTTKPATSPGRLSTIFTPGMATTLSENHVKRNSPKPTTIGILNRISKETTINEELPDELRITISSGDELSSLGNIAVETVTTMNPMEFSTQTATTTTTTTTEFIGNAATTFKPPTLTKMEEELPGPLHVTLPSITSKSESKHNGSISTQDNAGTIVFGFDLMSLGHFHTESLLQFINHVLPDLQYGKVALISNTRCTQNFNIPLGPATKEDITRLLSRLSKAKYPGLVDIIHQMNWEMMKERPVNGDKHPVRHIGILFVDLSVSEITPKVLMEADVIKKNGFELFVISIGEVSWTDAKMLMALSSQPHQDYVLSVQNYENLFQIVKSLHLQFNKINHKYGK